jgi:hypothetical protein
MNNTTLDTPHEETDCPVGQAEQRMNRNSSPAGRRSEDEPDIFDIVNGAFVLEVLEGLSRRQSVCQDDDP